MQTLTIQNKPKESEYKVYDTAIRVFDMIAAPVLRSMTSKGQYCYLFPVLVV